MSYFRGACPIFLAAGLVAVATLPGSVWALVPTTEIIAVAGDPAPDGNGSFSAFESPALNNAGQLVFLAVFTGTSGGSADDRGIIRIDGDTLIQIAREGESAPDGNGSFSGFSKPILNDVGQAAFVAGLTGTSGGSNDNNGLFRGDGNTLTQMARRGDPVPDVDASFVFFTNSLNSVGESAFRGSFNFTSGGSSSGIFRADGTMLIQIVRTGQLAPDGNGSFSGRFSSAAFNDAGQAAFGAFIDLGDGGSVLDEDGIFRGDHSTITQIARVGDAAPDGNGSFSGFTSNAFPNPAHNNMGQAAFRGFLSSTSGGNSDNEGIFRGDETTLTRIARKGGAAPDGNGSFASFDEFVALNDTGQVAFIASFTDTSGGDSDNEGIIRGNGTILTQIAREGEDAPDGNGSFSQFDFPALNGAGQMAFGAFLRGTSGGMSDNYGLYYFDDVLGLLPVARKGDPFLGSTITLLGFNNSIESRSDEFSGINELSQFAYRFVLADGRSGIAIWTVPEPASLALLALAAAVLPLRRAR